MPTCSFCGETFAHQGTMFVLETGQVYYFCSSKCEKNHKLKRKPRATRWTKTAHDEKRASQHEHAGERATKASPNVSGTAQ